MTAIVRPSDPDTSHAAAALNRLPLKQQVRRILQAHPEGLTDWEIHELTGLGVEHKPSVVNRRRENHAVKSGAHRLSPSGNSCVVWRLP